MLRQEGCIASVKQRDIVAAERRETQGEAQAGRAPVREAVLSQPCRVEITKLLFSSGTAHD
jgi:hypothetical protein